MLDSQPSRRVLLASVLAAGPATAAAARTSVAPPSSSPFDVRADFPIVETGRTFLNAAYITPIPRQVAAATAAFAEAKATRPMEVGELLRGCERVRGQFARLINASPDEVGLLFSTAEGENVVANGLELKPGDNIVIDDLHYDTEFVLYRRLEKTRGIQLRIVRNRGGAVEASDFEPFIDDRTRLVSVAWISHRNGFRHEMRPLCDLAHARGAMVYTDAIQAVGTVAVDVRAADVDFLCAGGYKWLLAGWGVAPFYVRRELSQRLTLDRYGEFHADRELPDGDFQIDATARRFDYSSRAFGEAHALSAGLTYLEGVGVARIEAHTVGLALDLWKGLAAQGHRLATPMGNRAPIVAFEIARPMGPGPRRLRGRQGRCHGARRSGPYRAGPVQHPRRHRALPGRDARTDLSRPTEAMRLDNAMQVINAETVRRELTYALCIPLVRDAMIAFSAGRTRQLLRSVIPLADGHMFGIMPGALGDDAMFGAKLVSVYPENLAKGRPSHQGVVVLFDSGTGAPTCVADAGAITAIRTAAASAVATDALARDNATRLTVLGYGEQAAGHIRAIALVRPIADVRVWGRDADRAAAFASEMATATGLAITAARRVQAAVDGADIVCTCTNAAEPILLGRWLAPGAHVNLVGSSVPGPVEVDDDLVAMSRFIVDSRVGVLAQGAEFLRAKAAGRIGDDHIAGEIGEVLSGAVAGRQSHDQVTAYKSLGHVVQDLAAASALR